MARKAKIGYWSSRKAYGIWINGVQHILAQGPDDQPGGPTFKAALAAYEAIRQIDEAGHAGDANTVRVVSEMYLQHLSGRRNGQETYEIRKRHLSAVCAGGLGELPMKELSHLAVYNFLDRQRKDTGLKRKKKDAPSTWSDGTCRGCLQSLQACFNWAQRSGLITKNPLKGIVEPEARSRGRDLVLTEAEHRQVLERVSAPFAIYLEALWNTGARPGEIANAKASHWDDKRGALVYQPKSRLKEGERSHKTGRKNKERVIRFSGQALAKVRELVAAHPTGYLYRPTPAKAKSRPGLGKWTNTTLNGSLRDAKERLGWSRPLCPYSYRHSFATRMLEAGISVDDLALLMGTSAEMIRNHYSHIAENEDYLRRQLERFSGQAAGTGVASPREG